MSKNKKYRRCLSARETETIPYCDYILGMDFVITRLKISESIRFKCGGLRGSKEICRRIKRL